MNTALLLQVKAAILAEPRAFDMSRFVREKSDSPCGTAQCIGGHAVMIAHGLTGAFECFDLGIGLEENAAKVLALSTIEAERLFYTSDWPSEFRSRFNRADYKGDIFDVAQIAADRIDHFIATNGAE